MCCPDDALSSGILSEATGDVSVAPEHLEAISGFMEAREAYEGQGRGHGSHRWGAFPSPATGVAQRASGVVLVEPPGDRSKRLLRNPAEAKAGAVNEGAPLGLVS